MAMIDIDGIVIEYAWFHPRALQNDPVPKAPIVLLHHGFGCVADWKSFPAKLAETTGRAALVYSRRGCGASSALTKPRDQAYLHDEERCFLPSFLEVLGVPRCHFYGHSDGATMALLFASAFPDRVLASVVEAAHVFAEDVILKGRAALTERYESDPTLQLKLARYHRDPDRAFYAWSRTWLLSTFRDWTIMDELATLRVPLLVIQGLADPFGSIVHTKLICGRAVRRPTVVELAACGHNPHVESEALILGITANFLTRRGDEQETVVA